MKGMKWAFLGAAAAAGIACAFVFGAHRLHAVSTERPEANARLMTVYDRGQTLSFMTHAKTLREALEQADITLDPHDTVEPSRDETLVAPEYQVNIYRARPVIVVDGAIRTKVMTPYQTAARIARDAHIPLYGEDETLLERSDDIVGDGAGLRLTIKRAVVFTLNLYGRVNEVRSHAATVGDMLKEKHIILGSEGRVSVPLTTPLSQGLAVRVWREGKQTISVDQPIGFATELIYDADRPVGYRAVQTPGIEGVRTISYVIDIKDGEELSRVEVANLVTKQPSKQVQIIGIQGLENGLTKNRGALFSTDSNGVIHRETYYDLPMAVVMSACGQGGRYTVRFDGMKIDAEGYIIVAANYARYPRCSIVETSAGPGRVYDTGGFVSHHPDGFDLATDWTRADGI